MSTATTIIEALGGWENISNLEAAVQVVIGPDSEDLVDEMLASR